MYKPTNQFLFDKFLQHLACACASLLPALAHAQITPTPPNSLKPIYWQQPLLFIPYQVSKDLPKARDIAEVQLLLSRNGSGDWRVLQSARPNVQGFSYHAPEDGEYWFALKHLDANGQPLDGPGVIPQLHLVIDTHPPQLALTAAHEGADGVVIRYDASDPHLNPQSLLIEARSDGGLWTNVTLAPPDLSQPGRLAGTARWALPPTSGDVEVRASVADTTGQRGQAATTAALAGPALPVPGSTLTPDAGPNTATSGPDRVAGDPFQTATEKPQDWPASNTPRIVNNSPALTGPPPVLNPYVTAGSAADEKRTPARFAVDGVAGIDQAQPDQFAPDLLRTESTPGTNSTVQSSAPSTDWAPVGAAPGSQSLLNARTFDLEYELASVGPWGVAKVEIWGTQDDGNTWLSYGVDPDGRSPARVTVPNSGTFGFRILVEGANAPAALPPQSGDKPELVVTVDLTAPVAEIIAVEPGEGNLADHLRIRWKAGDDNLDARPISLLYSSYPNGPWTTIASGLENVGSYLWRIERHVPGRLYLRLEARDVAGNVGGFQTPEPIDFNRPQPTGTLRSIRPVSDVPRVGSN